MNPRSTSGLLSAILLIGTLVGCTSDKAGDIPTADEAPTTAAPPAGKGPPAGFGGPQNGDRR